MIKCAILFISISLSACCVISQNANEKSPVDPYKLYTSGFNAAREHNDIYQDWGIFNPPFGVHKYARYNQKLKDSLYYVRSGTKKMEIALSFLAQYGTPLPEQCKKMKINLKYEYQTFKDSVFLMHILFNNKTTLLHSINITLEPTFSFKDTILPFSNKEIEVDIPYGANNCIIQLKTAIGVVALGSCDITIDGKKIEKYIYDQTPPFSSLELQKIKKELSDSLEINNQSQILGIGESLHGSLEFTEQASNIVKEKITNGGYNALYLEVPPLLGYHINQFVQGQDTILECVLEKLTTRNNSYFLDLLNFTKAYNQKSKEKVIIAGYDNVLNRNSLDSLFNDVASIYPKSEEIKSCINLLTELAKQDSRKIVKGIWGNDREKIITLLGQAIEKSRENHSFYECYIYSHLLGWARNSESISKVNEVGYIRDSLMANNVFFLYEHLSGNSKTMVLGHLGHIAKNKQKEELKGRFTSSMGYYLSQKYGEKYTVLGLYAGSGSFWASRYDGYNLKAKKGIYPVSYPIGKSIEQLCLLMNKSSFYINNIKEIPLLDRIVYERAQGVFWQPMQFEPVDLRKEMDAIWFTKENSPL